MSTQNQGKIDINLIETRARQMRAEYIAGFFKRRAR
jgi:hypothetical protein